MRVTLWGTRGSLATPGAAMQGYGGNTSCVGVLGDAGTMLVLDAGTGVRGLAATIPADAKRIDVLLTHLHMDHIQGLGFFSPIYRPDVEVHVWGPASTTLRLRARLMRYFSPPLFPVSLSELPSLTFHEVPGDDIDIGEFRICAALVSHPGPTVGYRITSPEGSVLTYLPDHEPALAALRFPSLPRQWTSGGTLAANADLLIHDAQYSSQEYCGHCGWGHSSLAHAMDFGTLAAVRQLVPFHHDPSHTDADIDRLTQEAMDAARPAYVVTPGREGAVLEI